MYNTKKSGCECLVAHGYGVVRYCDHTETRVVWKYGKPIKLTLSHKQIRLLQIREKYNMRIDSPQRPGHTRKTGGRNGQLREERVRERSLHNHATTGDRNRGR